MPTMRLFSCSYHWSCCFHCLLKCNPCVTPAKEIERHFNFSQKTEKQSRKLDTKGRVF